jgi:hypothetical protein
LIGREGGTVKSLIKGIIQDWMLKHELLQRTIIIILLLNGDIDPFIFHVIIMIELDSKRVIMGLLQYDIMNTIGITGIVDGMGKGENEFTNRMGTVVVQMAE